jgi:hypothetical protein
MKNQKIISSCYFPFSFFWFLSLCYIKLNFDHFYFFFKGTKGWLHHQVVENTSNQLKNFIMVRIVDGKIVEDLESQTPTSTSNSGAGDYGMSQMRAGMNNMRIGMMVFVVFFKRIRLESLFLWDYSLVGKQVSSLWLFPLQFIAT